jgi:alpha-L-fucosidase
MMENAGKKTWRSPLSATAVLGPRIAGEITPFVINDRLYRLENHPRCFDFPGADPYFKSEENEIRVRDVELNRIVCAPLRDHYFASAFVWNDTVYVFSWKQREPVIVMTSSRDLVNWTAPQVVIEAENNEGLFNTAVCRGKDKFIMLYETDDKRWQPPYTFKYCESEDLTHWKRIPGAVYGKDKYVGGPALYYEGGLYYTLYLSASGPVDLDTTTFETRITRSSDLLHWEDAPDDRPFITFDSSHRSDPEYYPDVYDRNASDAELCLWKDKTIVYFNGGNQLGVNDLQYAEFNGTPRALLECYYK